MSDFSSRGTDFGPWGHTVHGAGGHPLDWSEPPQRANALLIALGVLAAISIVIAGFYVLGSALTGSAGAAGSCGGV